jgi:alanyl-tRNA synthetase
VAEERLYYNDSYLTEFNAAVLETGDGGRRIYLDHTAFYPTSGGQPHDAGVIDGAAVVDVIDEGDRIAHVTATTVQAARVDCRIDWKRRFDHMQQHSGQHLLSGALVELLGIQTVGFHLGSEASSIDVDVPSFEPEQAKALEAHANELVWENRAITVAYHAGQEQLDLRKPPDREGVLRVVSIEGLDHSACGGTHVRTTGEIGPILIRRLEKAHGNARIEFLCGRRALRRVRADFDALSRIARVFSASPDEAPALVAAQYETLRTVEKARDRLAAELARLRGRELYETTPARAGGVRQALRRLPKGALDDELRATAQGFTAQPRAIFIAASDEPPALLLAASPDAGIHAGNVLKAAVAAAGGRGGGSATQAQGSVPSREALEQALRELCRAAGFDAA